MLQRLLLLFLMLSVSFVARATHIVGGEFEMQHVQGYNYRLQLNLYFDVINGSPGALDQTITVTIFEKGSNKLIRTELMRIKEQSFVPYTNIDCTVGQLSTKKIVYYETIYLPAATFNNPQGYYVTWERCCRNSTINNIVRPEDAAQTFYMEFPAVIKNGEPFVNSSPILFPPLSDYACVNEQFYFDFNGSDPDGDSIVYDMVTPLNGFTTPTMPVYTSWARPAPFPEISWLPGYNTSTQVQGNPAIKIDSETGQLTMRPSSKGLFVFGIRAQEYRKGVKIGEIRRDFQVLVLDCPRNQTPKVLAKESSKKEFYQEGQILRINSTDVNRCLNVLFTDPDRSEYVELRARPVNFSRRDYTFQGLTKGIINQGATSDTLKATLCFDECFDTEGKVYLMDLIVKDDGCSLPRQDTVRVSFIVEPTPDAPPALSLSTNKRVFEVQQGDKLNFNVLGIDADQDVLSLTAEAKNFTMASQQIVFANKSGTGQVSSPFSWDITCETLKQESYTIEFVLKTFVCNKEVIRKETIEVKTISANNVPTISSDQASPVIELMIGQPFNAKILGRDIDLDALALTASGQGFDLKAYGMTFTSTGGNGEANGDFSFTPTCEANQKGKLLVKFTLKENACSSSPDQELLMEFVIKDPNNAPTLTSDQSITAIKLKLNEAFEANLDGLDLDKDKLIMAAEGDGFNLADYGMRFTTTGGAGQAVGKFNWVATCLGSESTVLRVNFLLSEDACNPKPQKITMEFTVEAPKISDYVPSNIFTPNGDGKNDYFEVPGLPSDFCTATFTSVRIFNRWGREVYRSADSNFKWDGKDVNDGVYFYVIDYATSSYKGSVTLVR